MNKHQKLWISHHGEIPIEQNGKRRMVIHHINGDHSDNRIENLMLVTKSEHNRLHYSQGDIPPFTFEQCSKAGKIGGRKTAELGHCTTIAYLGGKERVKTLHAMKYKCNECEMVSSAGSIGLHQKASGHSGKTYLGTHDQLMANFSQQAVSINSLINSFL